MKTVKILMVSNVEGTGNPIGPIRETIGLQVYHREPGKETGTKGSSGVRENLKDWPQTPPLKRNPNLIL